MQRMYPKRGTRSSRIGQATLKTKLKVAHNHGACELTVVKAGVQPDMGLALLYIGSGKCSPRKASMFLEFLNILPVHDG
jgi:hypothetical protein